MQDELVLPAEASGDLCERESHANFPALRILVGVLLSTRLTRLGQPAQGTIWSLRC